MNFREITYKDLSDLHGPGPEEESTHLLKRAKSEDRVLFCFV